MLKKSNHVDVGGTCLQGYVTTTYEKLVEKFGDPSHNGDGYKTDAEWELVSDNGDVVTIYNWKDGPNYLGEDGTPVEYIIDWHIGGHNDRVIELVRGHSLLLELRKNGDESESD